MKASLILAFSTILAISFADMACGGEIKNETFDVDGTFDDYTGAGKLFHSYVTNAAPVIGVSAGICEMGLIAKDTATMYAIIDLVATNSLVSMKMDYKAIQLSSASSAFTLYFGEFPDEAFNPLWHRVTPGSRNWAAVRVNSSGYAVEAYDGSNTAYTMGSLNIGTTYTWSVFLNEAGHPVSYIGPDEVEYSLNSACWSFFIGTTQVGHNLPKGTNVGDGSAAYLRGIAIQLDRNWDGGTTRSAIDNVVIRDDLKLYQSQATTVVIVK